MLGEEATASHTSPLVSVVVPVFNRTSILERCLASIALQTHAAVEVLVVDDGSTEDVGSVVERVRWPPGMQVHVLRSAENRGPGAARERGRQAATGDHLAYLDSDDAWHPENLRRKLEALDRAPQAGMCYSTTLNVPSFPLTGAERPRPGSDRRHTDFLPIVLQERPWATGSCLWRKVATDAIGTWLEASMWEDVAYECRAGCLGIRIVHVNEPLCYVYASEERLSSTFSLRQARAAAASALRMADDCTAHGVVQDRTIRVLVGRRLERAALDLVRYGNFGLASTCWRAKERLLAQGPWSPARFLARLASNADRAGTRVPASRALLGLGQLSRRIERRLIKLPAGTDDKHQPR